MSQNFQNVKSSKLQKCNRRRSHYIFYNVYYFYHFHNYYFLSSKMIIIINLYFSLPKSPPRAIEIQSFQLYFSKSTFSHIKFSLYFHFRKDPGQRLFFLRRCCPIWVAAPGRPTFALGSKILVLFFFLDCGFFLWIVNCGLWIVEFFCGFVFQWFWNPHLSMVSLIVEDFFRPTPLTIGVHE